MLNNKFTLRLWLIPLVVALALIPARQSHAEYSNTPYIQLVDSAAAASSQGSIETMTSQVTSTLALQNVHVSFEVHAPGGTQVANPVVTLAALPSGTSPTVITAQWLVPVAATIGFYVLKVYVFNSDFSLIESYDNGYNTFQVFAKGGAPIPAPSARTQPIALGATVDQSSIDAFNALIYPGGSGHIAIAKFFGAWQGDGGFPLAQANALDARGAIPLDEWGSCEQGQSNPLCANAAIADGSYDTYLRAWAKSVAAWAKPFFLSFDHEMNGGAYPWGLGQNGNTRASDYVSMWRHVHSIFQAAGASNVVWVWSPNALPDGAAFDQFYPGDQYVNWVGMDGYNAGIAPSPNAAGGWHSLADEFRATYADLTVLAPSIPVLVGETASSSEGGDKAAWITRAFSDVPTLFPRVGAIIWFEANKEQDWRVESSQTTLAAFRQAATSSLYQGEAS